MEFEKGKYYEFDFTPHSQTHIIVIALEDGNKPKITTIKSFTDIHCNGDGGLMFESMYKPVNTFNDIHEVSARIKEIEAEKEKENWPVKVGQIWEVDLGKDNYNKVHCCYFIKVTDVKNKSGNAFEISVDVLYKHNTKTDDSYNYYSLNPNSNNLTLLTQAQYQQRIKELEEHSFKEGDYMLNDSIYEVMGDIFHHIDLVVYSSEGAYDHQFNGYSIKRTVNGKNKESSTPWLNNSWERKSFHKITEQEAIKTLTGKDYILLEEGQDVYDMKTVEAWRQVAEMFSDDDLISINGLQERHNHVIDRFSKEMLNLSKLNKNSFDTIDNLNTEIKILKEDKEKWANRYDIEQKRALSLESNIKAVKEAVKNAISNISYIERGVKQAWQDFQPVSPIVVDKEERVITTKKHQSFSKDQIIDFAFYVSRKFANCDGDENIRNVYFHQWEDESA